jgi:hypothetical protein
MQRLGLGGHAKKSARCPFHDDEHNSFSIYKNDSGNWRWKCFSQCGVGDEINFLEKHRGISSREATKLYLEMAGDYRGVTPFKKPLVPVGASAPAPLSYDWKPCVWALTENDLIRIGNQRRYSRAFVREIYDRGLVGRCVSGPWKDRVCFAVHDNGRVVAAHAWIENGNEKPSWRYDPTDVGARPLIIGDLVDGIHVFESQWDAFAFMDKSGERSGVIVTRGASNGALVSGLIADSSTVYVWTQNDAAGARWERDICANTKAAVKRCKIPSPHKDLNDWTKAGATSDDLLGAIVKAKPVPEHARLSTADNSLNSQLLPFAQCDDYPEPLGPAAFYGLAGEIVRRIEPHTEADPAALLFQFLAAFGNLIGHDHYIVADGTRHYLNLYGVLVGQSAKGRKGTSWNHVVNLMERVDPEWKQDRITHGLSSGEGLIWAVHDPIEETRPIREKGRHTGEYETYIANHGEDDKRLFVIEAEFANVLKVMAREGNTLSPVIRSAWDSGDLKTMVKNSPAKATKPHISIVGHITRDELRRLLTQTESANGFANRFCWVAVKRSKFLPDGGAIHTVKFEDVIAKLQLAIDFAKDFVEIVRDPEATKLWHEIYPQLSEGKPGMLGAITARAEAQVMRLSAIYALLDKSKFIRPEHHHAAMAVWRYCDQSARWIFGTSTGNKNADKILGALRHAPNGMTKTEINADVFNRHVSSADVDEALRLLQGLNMAYCRVEITGGAPLQRWFFSAETSEKSE